MRGGERLSRVLSLALTAASFAALADDGPTARFPKGLRPMALPLPPSDLNSWKAEECVGCHLEQAEDHAVVVTPALRDGTLCAACHQFGFSLRDHNGPLTGVSPTRPQQDTFAEWTRWKEQTGDARGCADCHAGGHAFGGPHPIDALRAAA